MCGRAACSHQTIETAKEIFSQAISARVSNDKNNYTITSSTIERRPSVSHERDNNESLHDDNNIDIMIKPNNNKSSLLNHEQNTSSLVFQSQMPSLTQEYDNWNLSPGMKSIIFHSQQQEHNNHCHHDNQNQSKSSFSITCSEQIWGLIPYSGTIDNPLPMGPNKHFSTLMFNARSDTLYDKPTFRNLLLGSCNNTMKNNIQQSSQSCIWTIDGYYEWKENDNDVINNDKKKQPYYVHRKDGKPLFIPGLWTSVYTGRMNNNDNNDVKGRKETLKSFTILTTNAEKSLRWLHHRQPVLIYDMQVAIEWLLNPNKSLLEDMTTASSLLTSDEECKLTWHPVSKQMSNVQYKGKDCIDEIKIEKVASIKTFFGSNDLRNKKSITSSNNRSITRKKDIENKNCIKKYISSPIVDKKRPRDSCFDLEIKSSSSMSPSIHKHLKCYDEKNNIIIDLTGDDDIIPTYNSSTRTPIKKEMTATKHNVKIQNGHNITNYFKSFPKR